MQCETRQTRVIVGLVVVGLLLPEAAGALDPGIGSSAAAPEAPFAAAAMHAATTQGSASPTPAVPEAEPAADAVSAAEMQKIVESLRVDAPGQPVPTAPGPVTRVLQSMNPDLSVILDVAAAAFSVAEPLQLGGHDPQASGFNLQQLEMHLAASVDPFLRFDGNLVFGLASVEMEEAFATTLALPANLQVRAGQFLSRFGRLNPTHPHQWHFVDQPLVFGKFFGSDGNRGLGTEGSWLSVLPWYLEAVLAVQDATGSCCNRSYLDDSDAAVRQPSDLLYTGAIKQFFPFDDDVALLWGVSAQTAPNNSDGRTAMYGTDVYLRWRPLEAERRTSLALQAEYLVRQRSLSDRLAVDHGGYAELVYNFDASWEFGARGEYVSGLADDPLDPTWTGSRRRWTAQITYYPSHFARLRLQGSADVPTWLQRPVYAAFLAIEAVVGAHGAHSY